MTIRQHMIRRAVSRIPIMVFLLAATFLTNLIQAQTTTINFDNAANWTAGSGVITSYQNNHTYTQGVFSATGGPALRETSATQDGFPAALGTYAWRLRDVTNTDWRITIASGGVSTFSVAIRRWDGSPSPNYALEYSINGGGSWSNVATINNTTLNNSSQYTTFSGTINSAVNNILIRLRALGTTERIMVDDFIWTAYSEPSSECNIEIDDIIVSDCVSGNDTFPNGYFLYDLYLSFNDAPPGGNLIITGPKDTTISVGSISSPLVITGLRAPANGSSFNINASFPVDLECSATLSGTSPAPCPIVGEDCSISINQITVSECIQGNDSFPDGYFLYDVQVIFSNQPSTGFLQISGPENRSIPIGQINSPYTFSALRGLASGSEFNVTVNFSEETECLASQSGNAPAACPVISTDCADLFISEYVEGSGFEKYIEIFNPTFSAINLSNYELRLYSNGAASPSQSANLGVAGMLPAGGTVVFRNGQATGFTGGFINSSVINHNGDDAFELFNISQNKTIDIFGRIGNDPGTAWTATGLSTVDRTLRRKPGVTKGIETNPAGTGPSAFTTLGTEWDGFPQNDVSGLGFHQSSCIETQCSINIVAININECELSFPGYPNGSFTFSVVISFSDAPSSGYLTISGLVEDSVLVSGISSPYTFSGLRSAADGNSFSILAGFSSEPACSDQAESNAPPTCLINEPCAELFFSEYIEGSGNNKCLEIFNPGPDPVNLQEGNYAIYAYFNGSSSVGLNIPLEGTIAAGGTHVVCNNASSAEFLAKAQQVPLGGAGWYNGNDAVALIKNFAIIDVIGQIGSNPGTAWTGAGVSTLDQTLVRKPAVNAGDPDGSNPFDPSIEWISYPVNTSTELGQHNSDCKVLPGGLEPSIVGDCDLGEVSELTNGDIIITSNCWGNMIGREANLLQTPSCGDFDFSAKVTVDPQGFAGIMFRESLSPDSRYVYLFVRSNGMVSLAVRSNPSLPAQVQSKPQANNQYMRMTREGNTFRCYLSSNGITWNPIFTSGIILNNCGNVGYATHSFIDGQHISSTYQHIQYITSESLGSRSGTFSLDDFSITEALNEIKVYPVPASETLNVRLPKSEFSEKDITITDLNGSIIYQNRSTAAEDIQIDLKNLAIQNGMYLLIVKDGANTYKTRFVATGH